MDKNNFKTKIKKFFKIIFKYKRYTVLLVFILFFAFISYEYYHYFYLLKTAQDIKNLILYYNNYSLLIFIIMQIIQVIVFFIPGEIIQIAGGYIFGTFLGGILSLLGITIGSCAVYFISNYFEKEFINDMIPKKNFKIFNKILNNNKKKNLIFILYIIPGIPKDALAYICGVSNINFKDFIIYSTLGRVPCIFISTYFGSQIMFGKVNTLIVITVVMTLLFVICTLKKDLIIKKISNHRH